MTKQLLIYESAIPVSSARHRTASVEPSKGYAFSAGINAVPLMAVEFLRAASEYAIVFTAAGDEVVPGVVLGIRSDQNLYLTHDAQWQAKYIPAFIRRYPFVFSRPNAAVALDPGHLIRVYCLHGKQNSHIHSDADRQQESPRRRTQALGVSEA